MASDRNTLKWSSIANAVAKLTANSRVCYERHGDDETLESAEPKLKPALEDMRAVLFEHPVASCTVKVDGTNVGIDSFGNIYGRNQMVDPTATNYMKTDLALLKSMRVAAIQSKVDSLGCPGESVIDRFVLYGELTCNKTLYDYACGMQTWSCFGAMLKLNSGCDAESFRTNLANAGLLLGAADGEEGDEKQPCPAMMLHVNETFKQLFPEVPYVPQWPVAEQASCIGAASPTLADLVSDEAMYNVVATGRQEGFVVILQNPETRAATALKWKNGGEAPGDSVRNLIGVEGLLASEKANIKEIREAVFSVAQLQLLPTLLSRLKKVYDNTERVDLNADGTVKQAKALQQPKKPATSKVFPGKVYADAVKSARTKFDHVDAFLDKGESGKQEYIDFITAECTSDVVETLNISVEDSQSVEWVGKHRQEVYRLLTKDKRLLPAKS